MPGGGGARQGAECPCNVPRAGPQRGPAARRSDAARAFRAGAGPGGQPALTAESAVRGKSSVA